MDKSLSSTLHYIASVLFYISTILSFVDRNMYIGIVCLVLGSAFFCFGSMYRKQENESKKFHEKYKDFYDQLVVVTLKKGNSVEGTFVAGFYEDGSILIRPAGNDILFIKINHIDRMEMLL